MGLRRNMLLLFYLVFTSGPSRSRFGLISVMNGYFGPNLPRTSACTAASWLRNSGDAIIAPNSA